MDRKEISSAGTNAEGNNYTRFSDGSYRYDNADGYHYKNSDGSTFTRKGDCETYKGPNGETRWTRYTTE